MKERDFIIVGQGLAGTLLAHFLKAAGKSVLLVDANTKHAASKVAAGIINPVTGRRFVKSWMIESLLPFAKATYRSIEAQLGCAIFHEKHILRALANPKEENDWLARATEASYVPYLREKSEPENYSQYIRQPYAFGETLQAAQVDIQTLIAAYRAFFLANDELEEANFDYQLIDFQETKIHYKTWTAQALVFCEGYGNARNPFFQHLPIRGDKGQALIVHIPGANFQKLFKDQIFIVPLQEADLYWVGATYEPRFEHERPTEEGRDFLLKHLSDCLKLPFEVVEHKSAVRPTVKDRRPLLGQHSEFSNLYIFNGLGTKGASLGPYWAQHMSDFLLGKTVLDPQVDIGRW